MRIGVVGQGYVGTAVKTVFEKFYHTSTFDLNGECSCKNLDELVSESDIIFICLPTPMKKNGSCDISIVQETVEKINKTSDLNNKIIAIKSTVPPGTTEKLNKDCNNISVLFNPEFLTEANFIEDFKNQNRIIIGGDRPESTTLRQVYSLVFPHARIVKTSSKIAEMVKYLTNTFLATKVSFSNDMKLLCDDLDIDYDKVVEYSIYDERLGKSHWAVPGPDGKLGFGGSCFPKDLNAILYLSKSMSLDLHTINGVWQTNKKVRPEEDWRKLKGRAVVADEE